MFSVYDKVYLFIFIYYTLKQYNMGRLLEKIRFLFFPEKFQKLKYLVGIKII